MQEVSIQTRTDILLRIWIHKLSSDDTNKQAKK